MQSLVPLNSVRPKRAPFLVSLLIHMACLVWLWQFAGPQPQSRETNPKPQRLTLLVAPPELHVELPPPKRLELRAPRVLVSELPKLPMPEPTPDRAPARTPEPSVLPRPSLRAAEAPPAPRPLPPPQAPPVRTNVFSSAESSPASNAAHRRSTDVQTGSFSQPATSMAANLHAQPSVGAFQRIAADSTDQKNGRLDVAAAGFGRAVAGPSTAARSQTETASSGFADAAPGKPTGDRIVSALATPSAGGFGETARSPSPPAPKAIHNGAFATVAAAAPETAAAKPAADLEPTSAVEVLYKPRPEYTQEGRKRQIEGEVLLEVLFSAKGELQVLRVLQGLGHGLDENAIKAARAIRFRPALHRGLPIDSDAIVRITFQLAY